MPKVNADLLAFNRGLVSPLALARTDVERTRLSAATITNWTAKTQGAMRLRPGSKYLGSSYNDSGAAWIEFIAATDDVASLELTDLRMRVWEDGDTLISRPTRKIAIETFSTDTGLWTAAGCSGGATATFSAGVLTLDAEKLGGVAKATRKVNLGDTGDKNVELGLAINVSRGPVTFMAGNDTGDDTYIEETTLRTGYHSLALTPTDTGGVFLTFQSTELVQRKIASIGLDDTGVMSITTPWDAVNLDDIRHAQSADVVFVACYGVKPMRIERRGTGRSSSVVEYPTKDGPFFPTRTNEAKLKPLKTLGNTTIQADKPVFQSGHVGGLIRMLHDGQNGDYRFQSKNAYSDVWKVTGINDTGSPGERTSIIVTNGTWNGKLRLQRSFAADGGFRTKQTITTNTTVTDIDGDDNITAYYRLAVLGDTGDYIFGTIKATVDYPGGAKDGVARITAYTSPTSVSAEVLSRFSDTGYVEDWAEGRFSGAQTWPSSVEFHEGRLWWFGATQLYGSVSDDYENFNAGTIGDSAPINRTLNTGPVDRIHWAISLLRMFIGTAGEEIALRSTSLDEPLTPSNMAAKTSSTIGGANLRAGRIDDRAIFVNRAEKRLYMIAFEAEANDYRPQELTLLVPDLLSGVTSIAVQRQPDTRIHCVLDDGTVAIATYEAQEQVLCWSLYKTTAASGAVEKVIILPGSSEDQVYYHVRRTINGATKRYLERLATETESNGDTGASWLVDCAVEKTLSDTGVATGLGHLQGEKVIIWAAKDLSYDDTGGDQTTYTVASSVIQLGAADTGFGAITAQIGLPYVARTTGKEMDAEYKSTKLAYAAAAGTALTMPKRVDHLGVILGKTHNNGLFYGKSLTVTDLQRLPRVIEGRTLNDTGADRDEIFSAQDLTPFEFPGDYDVDSRLCLAAKAPRPCTLMAAIIGISTHDKI